MDSEKGPIVVGVGIFLLPRVTVDFTAMQVLVLTTLYKLKSINCIHVETTLCSLEILPLTTGPGLSHQILTKLTCI